MIKRQLGGRVRGHPLAPGRTGAARTIVERAQRTCCLALLSVQRSRHPLPPFPRPPAICRHRSHGAPGQRAIPQVADHGAAARPLGARLRPFSRGGRAPTVGCWLHADGACRRGAPRDVPGDAVAHDADPHTDAVGVGEHGRLDAGGTHAAAPAAAPLGAPEPRATTGRRRGAAASSIAGARRDGGRSGVGATPAHSYAATPWPRRGWRGTVGWHPAVVAAQLASNHAHEEQGGAIAGTPAPAPAPSAAVNDTCG